MLDQVWNSLVAAGPVALVLGLMCFFLWRALADERIEAAKERVQHAVALDVQRREFILSLSTLTREYITSHEHERERHSIEEEKIRAEYVATLKKFTEAARENKA